MVGKREMRSIVLKYLTAMVMVAALTFMVGCDDADILEETGLRFRVGGPITFDDDGVDDGSFDAYDTAAGGCEPDETEQFAYFQVTVPYESDENMNTDGYIDHIDVDITPNGVTDFLVNDFTITNIQNPRIPANGGTLDLTIYFISPAMKAVYVDEYGGTYDAPNRRSFSVTLSTYVTYTPYDEPEEDYRIPDVTFGMTATEIENCE